MSDPSDNKTERIIRLIMVSIAITSPIAIYLAREVSGSDNSDAGIAKYVGFIILFICLMGGALSICLGSIIYICRKIRKQRAQLIDSETVQHV